MQFWLTAFPTCGGWWWGGGRDSFILQVPSSQCWEAWSRALWHPWSPWVQSSQPQNQLSPAWQLSCGFAFCRSSRWEWVPGTRSEPFPAAQIHGWHPGLHKYQRGHRLLLLLWTLECVQLPVTRERETGGRGREIREKFHTWGCAAIYVLYVF